MSEEATCRWRNVVALSFRVSAAILSSLSSASVGITQPWSHCWTHVLTTNGPIYILYKQNSALYTLVWGSFTFTQSECCLLLVSEWDCRPLESGTIESAMVSWSFDVDLLQNAWPLLPTSFRNPTIFAFGRSWGPFSVQYNSSLVPRPFYKTENQPMRKGLGKWPTLQCSKGISFRANNQFA